MTKLDFACCTALVAVLLLSVAVIHKSEAVEPCTIQRWSLTYDQRFCNTPLQYLGSKPFCVTETKTLCHVTP